MVFSVPKIDNIIPDSSNIFDDATDYVKSNVEQFSKTINKYFVAPHDNYGIGGFLFDISGDQTVNLDSEITDHTIEDNSQIQDHITLRSKKITLRGYVGELVYRDVFGFSGITSKLTGKLGTIAGLAPNATKGMDQYIGKIGALSNKGDYYYNLVSNKISGITSIWDFFNGKDQASQTNQQKAFQYFSKLRESKILVSVQTPFEYFNNMAIESIVALQREESGSVSDFSITLKQMTKAKVKIVAYDPSLDVVGKNGQSNKELQGRAAQQSSPVKQIGRMTGQQTNPYGENLYLAPELKIGADQVILDKQYNYDPNSIGIGIE